MPVKELTDAFLRTLTWTRALKDVPEAEGERPIKQITYLNRLDRGLSLVFVLLGWRHQGVPSADLRQRQAQDTEARHLPNDELEGG